MRYLSFILALTLCAACDKGRSMITSTAKAQEKEALEDAGVKLHYYSNGKIKAKIPMDKDNKRHGISEMYYPTGALKSQVTYEHGTRQLAKQYFKDGKLEMEFPYEGNMKHGVRKKYWDTGELQSQLEYFRDEAGSGLVEYTRKGKKISIYPTLQVKQINNLSSTGEYIVEVSFSKQPSRGTYYQGELIDGRFKHRSLVEMDKVNGRARIVFNPSKGASLNETFHFVGSWKTLYNNPYIASKSVTVSFSN